MPKPVALPDVVRRVDVIAVGSARIITPDSTHSYTRFEHSPRLVDFGNLVRGDVKAEANR